MFKKIISAICVAAMVVTTAITSVMAADTYNYGLRTGVTAADLDGDMYSTVVLTVDKPNVYFGSSTIAYKVTKGVFVDAEKAAGITTANGMYCPKGTAGAKRNTAPSFDVAFSDTASNDFDIVTVQFYGDLPYYTTTGDIVEIKLYYNEVAEAEFEIYDTKTTLDVCNDQANPNASNVTSAVYASKKYKMANTVNDDGVVPVTEVSDKPAEKHVEVAVKNAKGEDVNLATPNYNYNDVNKDVAVAFMATVTPNNDTVNGLTWTVKSGDVEKQFAKTFDGTITGATAVSYGLIIKGIDTVQSVNAAATVATVVE